jgi:hypothetical protein
MPDSDNKTDGPAKKFYVKGHEEREHYLRRARQAARYTIPSLMPETGMNKSTSLYTPYQGLGQRGLNNLSSKLLLILMPPDQPMFKLDIDDYQLNELIAKAGKEGQAARGELDEGFNRIERAVTTDLAATTMRKSLSMAMKQLLVAGNVGIFQDKDGSARVWRLDQFVLRRDPSGLLLEMAVLEMISREILTDEQRTACDCERQENEQEKALEIYTHIKYSGSDDRYYLVQEINGHFVPGSARNWPAEKTPLVVPTTNRLPGENYGRGYIETVCLGDLISFEGLSKSMLEAAAMAAKVLWMRNPNSTVRARDLEKANGSVINGNPNDVGALRLDKNNDFQVALQQANNIESRLEQVFMLNQSVQRKGERVTATEIQFVAQDIEDALGNLYSDLASDWQLPIVVFQLHRLTLAKRIPALPKGVVKPRITTGLAALGRGQDLRKIQGFVNDLNTFGGERASMLVNESEFTKRLGAGHGIDMNGLIKTQEQIAAQVQQEQQAATAAATVPGVAKEAAKAAGPEMVKRFLPDSQ